MNPNKRRTQCSRTIAVLLACLMIFVCAEAGFTRVDASEPVPQQPGPVPTFYMTWTATAKGFSDTTDSSGTRSVYSRRIMMTGSSIYRKYANGNHDNYPLDLTVTDDLDQLETYACAGGGVNRTHIFRHITDPRRYIPGPLPDPPIYDVQRPDGSWYILDPFVGFYYNRGFNYRTEIESTDCNGEFSTFTTVDPNGEYHSELGYPTGITSTTTIEGGPTGTVFAINVERRSVGGLLTIRWEFTARRLTGRDLTVERLEVTQGLQDGSNSIPLVRGRRTVVRAYLGVGKDQVPIPNVTGKLTGYSGSTNLGSVRPFNPGGRITAPVMPNWRQIDHTLNFELPHAWTLQPSLSLEVEVNDDRSVIELDYTNNKYAYFDTTVACRPLSIAYRPIHYAPPGGYSLSDPSPNIIAGQEFMRKIYPLADNNLSYASWVGFTMTVNINDSGNSNLLLSKLYRDWLNSSSPKPDHLYGWLPSQAFKDNGWGQNPGLVAFGNDTESPNKWRRTFAHEIGHNFGLDHTSLTTAGRHWFDVYERKIKAVPASAGGSDLLDVMVPERLEEEAWISPDHYLYLMGKLCSGSSASVAPPAMHYATAGDNLIVTGTVISDTTPVGSLNPLYRTSTAPLYILPPPEAGPGYCVKLKNNTTLLSQYCFGVGFDGDGAPASMMPFGMVITYPVGLNRVELTRGTTTLLSSRVASANSPTVTVAFPNAPGLTLSGAQTIQWTGSDADGDPLSYNILYSRDNGATWIGVASGITTTSSVLDFAGVPGSGNGRIKVQVSDGFNSAEDVSDNPFSVANKPPTAAIISPPANARFNTDETVVLQGSGLDLEDGSLGDSTLTWRSTKDGALGTGRLLEKTLSAGRHTITLTVTDSGGLSHSTSIQVSVAGKIFLPVILR